MTRPSSSLHDSRRTLAGYRLLQSGAAVAETIVIVPALLLVGMAVLHFALLAQARSNLEYATLMAARIASSQPNFGISATRNQMVEEVITRMKASELLPNRRPQVNVCILRPNQLAFNDFGTNTITPGSVAIPNSNLTSRSTANGPNSGMSIQDANILHLQVSYRFDTPVPFMNFYDDDAPSQLVQGKDLPLAPYTASNNSNYRGLFIRAETALTMQTHALLNNLTAPFIAGSPTFRPCN